MNKNKKNEFWLYSCIKCKKDIHENEEYIMIKHFIYKSDTKRTYFCCDCFKKYIGDEFLLSANVQKKIM